jgi:hypothetical protein
MTKKQNNNASCAGVLIAMISVIMMLILSHH